MFRPRTVFVIGAGASAEVGLPSGREIIKTIRTLLAPAKNLDEQQQSDLLRVFEELASRNSDDGDNAEWFLHIDAAKKIMDGATLAVSIDNFMHTHRGDKYIQIVGKLAIAHAILQAEKNSSIRPDVDEKVYLDHAESTWFRKFAMKLFEGRTKDELPKIFDEIEVVCFNYDRCIEHFLRHAMASYFLIHIKEAEEIVDKLRIYRPYGTVGSLPTVQYKAGYYSVSTENLAFGKQFSDDQLIEASKQIRIFTEDTTDNDNLNDIQNCIKYAKHIVFLGFGYIPQNMSLFHTEIDLPNRRPTVRGTAHGISDDDRKTIESRMWDTYRPPEGVRESGTRFDIKLENCKCSDFFDRHWYELG